MPDAVKRTILVTGGSRGIGRGICRAFALSGNHIYFNYASAADAALETEKLVADAGGKATAMQVNVAVLIFPPVPEYLIDDRGLYSNMIRQRTLKNVIRATGVGLHTGNRVNVKFFPAKADEGITFVRTDLPGCRW